MPLVAFVLSLLIAVAPAAALDALVGPWPSAEPGADVVEEDVRFSSSSPFTPAHIADAEPTEAVGRLFLPAGADAAPAVVLMHGASGVRPAREIAYGRQLARMGIAALVVDSFGARRDRGGGFTQRLLEITESMLVADVYAGLGYLAGRPEIDASRVALVGFSYGGMAAMYSLWAPAAEALLPGGPRFAGHVAFYAPCIVRFAEPRTTGAPLLILYGDDDALIDPERCSATAREFRDGGSEVEIVVYEGAAHQWDGGMGRRPIGRLLTACRLSVTPEGRVRDEITRLSMRGPVTRRLILAACIENRPYMIGADDAVRALSNADLGRFLARVLGGG